jgi:arylsulfatase A-like enzyme
LIKFLLLSAGQTSNKVLHVVDLPVTMLQAANLSFPGHVDGFNLFKVVDGTIDDHYEIPLNIMGNGTGNSALRMGDMKYVSADQV